MSLWGLVFVISTGLAAMGFVVVAVLWLKKLRETLATTLGETAGQQIRTAQRLGDSLSHLQRQQQNQEQRLQDLMELNDRMRREINVLTSRLELTSGDLRPDPPSRMVH
ncbi:MAG TPA: hypothetical protein DCY07_07625 [Rhodospirillaceae bacterium]|nr:hypothetical protein [Rhodospirillaceae bacterium]